MQGTLGAEVTPSVVRPALPLTETVGAKVMVEGMSVTMPGFWGTQAAQIPVK